MEWTRTSDGWRSGPYLIELMEPGRWALYRNSESDSSDLLVRMDPVMTGGSLRRMKEEAESIERQSRDAADKRRMLTVLLTALAFFLSAVGHPGAVAMVISIASFGVALWALLRLLHGRTEPWESLRHMHQ
jgi:hypothetical protein